MSVAFPCSPCSPATPFACQEECLVATAVPTRAWENAPVISYGCSTPPEVIHSDQLLEVLQPGPSTVLCC